jgi:hypothetical protein
VLLETLCNGQGKTDTLVSNCGEPREVRGTDIPERHVHSRAVIAPLEVIEHIIPRFLRRGLVTQRGALTL